MIALRVNRRVMICILKQGKIYFASTQNFVGRWMPESHGLYRVFYGEFFWAPAFEYHNVPYYHHDGWTRGRENIIPKEVLVSTDQYIKENGTYDCSIDETIQIYIPAKLIVEGMDLRWNGNEGNWFDRDGNLIAFDPSTRVTGPGVLLVNRDKFLDFLNDNDYAILWTILGEKNIISDRPSQDWKGRLELSGAFRNRGKKIEGAKKSRFFSGTKE